MQAGVTSPGHLRSLQCSQCHLHGSTACYIGLAEYLQRRAGCTNSTASLGHIAAGGQVAMEINEMIQEITNNRAVVQTGQIMPDCGLCYAAPTAAAEAKVKQFHECQ